MVRMRALFVSALVGSAALLAACNGGAPSFVSPAPGPTCAPGETVQMIYPIPGATGVPDNPQQLVFALASPLPSTWNAYVNNTNSLNGSLYTIAGMQTISASQIPQPAATPSIANPVYQSITLAQGFSAQQTIYVWLNDSATTCTPLGPLGSFTTQ